MPGILTLQRIKWKILILKAEEHSNEYQNILENKYLFFVLENHDSLEKHFLSKMMLMF